MFYAEKRIKLSDESSINKNKKKSNSAADSSEHLGIESGYHSHADFTNSTEDFSLPPVKRKSSVSRQFSLQSSLESNKQSFDLTDLQQSSSGYSSLLSSSSSPRKSHVRTPKKRKQEADENAFYNSYQFVSPPKIRKKDPSDDNKRAKLILKEKSSSENVILSSTPIRSNNDKGKWGKFRSLHPEKFEIGKSLEDVESFEKVSTLSKSTDASFTFGASLDFTNSFELSSNTEQSTHNIPSDVHQLLTHEIKEIAKPRAEPTETVTKSQETNVSAASQTSSNMSSSSRTYFHCGRLKMDILSKLHDMDNLALKMILGHLSDIDLLSISHVSKNYKQMIKADKKLHLRKQSYLKAQLINRENRTPDGPISTRVKSSKVVEKEQLMRPFEDSNVNHSMQLRSKPLSPPVSPSRKRFHENQKVAQSHKGFLKKCPVCLKPAKINSIKIRSSPRKQKKKNYITKISAGSGRVHKTFLSKPSIDSLFSTEQLYATFPGLDERSSSSCSSPGSPSSDESSCNELANEADVYEYGVCSGISCNFKFCVKCNCKYHPRQLCKDLAPASPSRSFNANKSVACSSRSLKSLKRLIY